MREEYATHYEGLKDIGAHTAADAVDTAKVQTDCSERTLLTRQQVSKNMFDNIL